MKTTSKGTPRKNDMRSDGKTEAQMMEIDDEVLTANIPPPR